VPYTITYGNPGSTAMGAVLLSVTLPANTTYVSSTPSFAPQGGGVHVLNLGTLASNQSGSATFRVRVNAGTEGQKVLLNARIGGAFPELSTADNTASKSTPIVKRDIYMPMFFRNFSP
jgi:hypothetical protein